MGDATRCALKDVNCERADNAPYVSIIEITTTREKGRSSTTGVCVGQPVPIGNPGEHRYRCITAVKNQTIAQRRAGYRVSRKSFSQGSTHTSEQGARGSAISDIRVAEIVDIIPDRWHVRY